MGAQPLQAVEKGPSASLAPTKQMGLYPPPASRLLAWGGPLRGGVQRVERLAGGHEEPVALGTAEAHVAADLRQTDAPDELALRRPDRHAAVTDVAAGVARAPDVAVDVAARAVRSTLHAIDHEVAEELSVRQLVVAPDVEHVHLALAARPGVAGPLAGADHVELLVVGREHEPVRIRHLVLTDDEVDAAARVDAIHAGRQLPLGVADLQGLPEARLEPSRRVARSAGSVRCPFVELPAVGRIGEPVAAVRMRHDVVGGVEPLAVVLVRDQRDRSIVLVADHASGQVLARELAALEVESVAVAVVRRAPEDRHVTVVLEPAQLPIVGDVAPHQIPPLAVPGRPFRPQGAGPQALYRRVGLPEAIERRLDGENVRVREVRGGRPARTEIARGTGDRAGWRDGFAGRLSECEARRDDSGAGDGPYALDEHPS